MGIRMSASSVCKTTGTLARREVDFPSPGTESEALLALAESRISAILRSRSRDSTAPPSILLRASSSRAISLSLSSLPTTVSRPLASSPNFAVVTFSLICATISFDSADNCCITSFVPCSTAARVMASEARRRSSSAAGIFSELIRKARFIAHSTKECLRSIASSNPAMRSLINGLAS